MRRRVWGCMLRSACVCAQPSVWAPTRRAVSCLTSCSRTPARWGPPLVASPPHRHSAPARMRCTSCRFVWGARPSTTRLQVARAFARVWAVRLRGFSVPACACVWEWGGGWVGGWALSLTILRWLVACPPPPHFPPAFYPLSPPCHDTPLARPHVFLRVFPGIRLRPRRRSAWRSGRSRRWRTAPSRPTWASHGTCWRATTWALAGAFVCARVCSGRRACGVACSSSREGCPPPHPRPATLLGWSRRLSRLRGCVPPRHPRVFAPSRIPPHAREALRRGATRFFVCVQSLPCASCVLPRAHASCACVSAHDRLYRQALEMKEKKRATKPDPADMGCTFSPAVRSLVVSLCSAAR